MDGIGQAASQLCASSSPPGKQGQALPDMGPEALYHFNFYLMMDLQVLEIDGSNILSNISIFSTWPFIICTLLASSHSFPTMPSEPSSVLHPLWAAQGLSTQNTGMDIPFVLTCWFALWVPSHSSWLRSTVTSSIEPSWPQTLFSSYQSKVSLYYSPLPCYIIIVSVCVCLSN